ncbi:ribosomal-protein-alanine acetyltransferase [Leptolyngbya sp. Heron Island J]|uniref:ribosomal protein S18-alanine N-acetyltransferase n=1 Tax=Leptolyngbya sp. Heron Island J TaxID=1385935 RepID=UPI0003B995AF|nr:ribosomal protein S18-alanine N-acetyltransferase [Leptolyngbya sp. Heron Island J]ESA35055.1 ribosomal-protein-alanine acetyltransferase [Leptolyngbya sp. Heron Island J]
MATTTPLTCQLLTNELLPAVLDLDQICLGGLWTEAGYRREIDSPNSDLLVLLAHEYVIGLGCVWAILDEAHITTLAIHPDYHRQRLGQLLLIQLLQQAHQRSLTHATLEVRASNHRALQLYQKFGFRTAGQRKRYYQDGENALILWRSQLQTPEFQHCLTHLQRECAVSFKQNHYQWLPDVTITQ